jgi:nucleolar MIF4G domain-containing protein 1
MVISTQIKARKEERKLKQKKGKRSRNDFHGHDDDDDRAAPTGKRGSADKQRKKMPTGKHYEAANQIPNKKKKTESQSPTKKLKLISAALNSHSSRSDSMDPSTFALLEQDDKEIASLEKKLGLSKRKEKDKLYKEYSMEGYGDDFGDFLEDLDNMVERLKKQPGLYKGRQPKEDHDGVDSEDNESSDGEELAPMKDPYDDMDEDDSVLEELQRMKEEEAAAATEKMEDKEESDSISEKEEESGDEKSDSDGSSSSSGGDDDSGHSDQQEDESDHDVSDTYRPSKGEDIYGKTVDSDAKNGNEASRYVPPHLRKKQLVDDDEDDQEKRRMVTRSLNSALNRLSEDTLISVAQQVAGIYSSNATQLVHEQVWKNAKGACVELPMLMTGLIPVYTACLTGVHLQTGDTVQVGEAILEYVVVEMWQQLENWRKTSPSDKDDNDDDDKTFQKEIKSKHICNLILILSYLYNYNVVHCSLMYDVIRHLIDKFSEVDIECLLILLSHCGRSLRSDDPLALKEIVLLVQKKKAENPDLASSSRAEYMVSAIMDLKNNRRKKQDNVFSEKTGKFRKLLGQIKSAAAKSGVSKASSEASLRISLEDILNAETKGRWWKVGASWVGNQYRFSEGSEKDDDQAGSGKSKTNAKEDQEDEMLLKIATKLRMNTDRKRSIFCIIMGGTDCEDTFEKLCRSSMLHNRNERDVVRVLLECCGHEKSYNKFYGHLAARICEYQPQSRFSLQIAYWDTFKQFDSMDVRKAANLAKLLFHLVVTHRTLRLIPVIKRIDISEEDMDQTTLLFLTLLVSSILEHYDDPVDAKSLFSRPQRKEDTTEESEKALEEDEGVRAGLLLFFMETLKNSPKNKKGSRFHKNFKAVIKELDSDGFETMF